jgi:hypothetical protein
MSMTLKVSEIRSLAAFVGLVLDERTEYDEDELETEFTIADCPADFKDEDGEKPYTCDHIAYSTEYPEEGCVPLGPNAL